MQALAQDQMRALHQMCSAAFGDDAPRVEVYDGDTSQVSSPDCQTVNTVAHTADSLVVLHFVHPYPSHLSQMLPKHCVFQSI